MIDKNNNGGYAFKRVMKNVFQNDSLKLVLNLSYDSFSSVYRVSLKSSNVLFL